MLNARVHRVRLRVARDAQLPRARKLLEDALSQSGLSLASGRLLIVRSLDVGSIRSGAAPADVSARIENDVRRLQRSAVRGEDSAASDAPMVYFESALSAYVALALRLCRGQAAREWFWPLAVPQYRQGMDRPAALRAVLFGALENDPPPLAAAALSGALCEQRCLTPLVASLQRDDGALLLARCGWKAASDIGVARIKSNPQSNPDAQAQLPPSSVTVLRDGEIHDDVKQWLCCALLVAAAPHRAADPQLLTRARESMAVLARSDRTMMPAGSAATSEASVVVHARRRRWLQTRAHVTQDPARTGHAPPRASFEAVASEQRLLRGLRTTEAVEAVRQEHGRTVRLLAAPALAGDRMSENAGLLFLINAASRLGIERWLSQNGDWADWGLVPRLFAALADRLGICAADPIVGTLPQGDGVPAAPSRFELPVAWQALSGASPIGQRRAVAGDARLLCTLSGRLPLAGVRGPTAATADLSARFADAPTAAKPYRGSLDDALIDAWVNAMRLWCRGRAGVGLHAVVRRPGRVFHSATQVRVSFDLQSVDIRLRRVGLDLDPGWAPWFGRVVSFTYGAGDGDE